MAIVRKLENFVYNGVEFDPLWVITDDNGAPSIVSLLYSAYLSRYGITYRVKQSSNRKSKSHEQVLIEREIEDATIRSYVYCLTAFFDYLDVSKSLNGTPSMHMACACSENFVNHYLNKVVPNQVDSINSLNNHLGALSSFFNWLDQAKIAQRLTLKIDRKTKQELSAKSTKPHYIKYISRFWRLKLLNECPTLRDKLILRMGYEVGLRTSELVGLMLESNKPESSLKSLFLQLEKDQTTTFKYVLQGKYTKRGRTRFIYFSRDLLTDMKRYYETERSWVEKRSLSKTDDFFLRIDKRFFGTGIGEEQASRVFRKIADRAGLSKSFKNHDLRHTFATEEFDRELQVRDGQETRSESAALIAVAIKLGHKLGKDGLATEVTTRYISLRTNMLDQERIAK